MSSCKKKILALDGLLTLILIAFDQFTKQLAVTHLKGKEAFVLIKGVLELDYLENRGAAFGMLQNQKIFLVAVGVIFLAAICFFLLRVPDGKKYLILHILASVIISGGLGNIDYPIFNVADIYVVVATICVFILLLFVYKEEDLAFLGKKEKADK